ncbi:MAG: response regulator [Gammaproteobacteria bacterium]|nr:response regulator [Gammaproteobacteria bacterium]
MQVNTTTGQPAIRVLLAGSGKFSGEQIAGILEQSGFELLRATDGFEVLCRLPELRPDVLVMASDLPRLSGIQVCSLLRQSPDFAALPVLLLTGQHAVVDQVRAKMAGANACLDMPLRSADLKQAFAGLFSQQQDDWQPSVASTPATAPENPVSGLSVHC